MGYALLRYAYWFCNYTQNKMRTTWNVYCSRNDEWVTWPFFLCIFFTWQKGQMLLFSIFPLSERKSQLITKQNKTKQETNKQTVQQKIYIFNQKRIHQKYRLSQRKYIYVGTYISETTILSQSFLFCFVLLFVCLFVFVFCCFLFVCLFVCFFKV